MELTKPEEYFPYIQHTLDQGRDPLRLKENMIDRLFSQHYDAPHGRVYTGHSMVFSEVVCKIPAVHQSIAADPKAVQVLVPRHRSLFDYAINQPVHHDLINGKIMIVVGHNLLVHRFDSSLRNFGGFMFLRNDEFLQRPGLPRVWLTKDRYLKEVFPAYLRDQMVSGFDPRHDLMVYLEYERDTRTGRSNAGRTKTGRLRKLNWSFLRVLHDLVADSDVRLFITPINVSFSKVPDTPFVVHPTKLKGVFKKLSYLHEQRFVFHYFPSYAERHPEGKIRATVTYGAPEAINDLDFSTFREIKEYADGLRARIGLLETVYPAAFLFAAMGNDTEVEIRVLDDRVKRLFALLRSKGVDCAPISDVDGGMLPTEAIVDLAALNLNTNPNFLFLGPRTRRYIKTEHGRVVSSDPPLQAWYANSLAHFFDTA